MSAPLVELLEWRLPTLLGLNESNSVNADLLLFVPLPGINTSKISTRALFVPLIMSESRLNNYKKRYIVTEIS